MNRDQFEKKLLELWMESRVPLTRVNVQYYTEAPRKKMEAWLDELVLDDVLELIVGNDGEIRWKVRGAKRPLDGPVTFDDMKGKKGKKKKKRKKDKDDDRSLSDDLDLLKGAASTALAVREVKGEIERGTEEGKKSYLWAAGLGLLGPLGWLYAGAWKEAVPASLIYMLLLYILPTFLLGPILGVGIPVSIVAGLLYAYKYNKAGERRPILDWESDESDD